jgi:hypothetical protein
MILGSILYSIRSQSLDSNSISLVQFPMPINYVPLFTPVLCITVLQSLRIHTYVYTVDPSIPIPVLFISALWSQRSDPSALIQNFYPSTLMPVIWSQYSDTSSLIPVLLSWYFDPTTLDPSTLAPVLLAAGLWSYYITLLVSLCPQFSDPSNVEPNNLIPIL